MQASMQWALTRQALRAARRIFLVRILQKSIEIRCKKVFKKKLKKLLENRISGATWASKVLENQLQTQRKTNPFSRRYATHQQVVGN